MARSHKSLPDRAAEVALHQQLLDNNPTAPADLAETYLDAIADWLAEHNRKIDKDLCDEAAGEAIVALIKNPASYRREKQRLYVYLRMSAQKDLQNLLAKEKKHREGRIGLKSVELSPQAGKYLGIDDDPSLLLRVKEEEQRIRDSVPESVLTGLTEAEVRVFHLMRRGVKKTAELAKAAGIADLPIEKQRRELYRLKNLLKKRLERAEEHDERAS